MKYFKILEDESTDYKLVLDGYVAIFGGKDLVGETFTPETDFESPYTRKNTILIDWEHGMEPDSVKNQPGEDDILGHIDWLTARQDDIGLLARHVLDRRERYVREFVEPLAKAGLLGSSSEATRKGVVVSDDGIIEKWPLKRQSFTVNPTEKRLLTDYQMQVVKSLGLKSLLDAQDSVEDEEPSIDNGDMKMSEKDETTKAVDSRFEKIEGAIGELADSVKTVVEALEKFQLNRPLLL